MEKHTKIIVIAAALIVLLIIVVALVAGSVSSSGGGGEEQGEGGEHVPVNLPISLDPSKCPSDYGPRSLLLVSLDGFRADFLLRNVTPTIQLVAERGVHAEYMVPSYPTVTFPNHYSIVTGLYPEAHGIITNRFYDPVFKQRFSLGGNEKFDGKWWGGEPIWNTITRQGKLSATFFWPGSDADINGKHPTHWKTYNESIPYNDRVLQVLQWLSLPVESRPSFVSLYFDEPDHAGHEYGPNSKEVNEQLDRVDKTIDLLMRGLLERNLLDCVNVIIVADHGQVDAGEERVIDLKNYLPNLKEESSYETGVVGMIGPKNKTEAVKLDMIRNLVDKRNEMRVFRREELPKRFHFSKNRRIMDIIFDLDPGFTVQYNSTWSLKGQHGYDYYYPEMHALFLAYGPDFKQGAEVRPFQNIELYNLMCHLIGVTPAENNGTWGSLHHLLENPPPAPSISKVNDLPVLRFPKGDLRPHWNASGCDVGGPAQHPWMSSSLNFTEDQEKIIISYHLPWGAPQTRSLAQNVSLLLHNTHVTGFSASLKMPVWTSLSLNADTTNSLKASTPPGNRWISDPRVPNIVSPQCKAFRELELYQYSAYALFGIDKETTPDSAKSVHYLVTNAIPVHNNVQDRWLDLLDSILSWSDSFGPLNILLGPVFDGIDNPHVYPYVASGKAVPSDLFAVLTRCSNLTVDSMNNCPAEHLDARSFILHQYQPVENTLNAESFLTKFSATGRDVERITGFTLYPDLPFENRINLTLAIHPHIWPLPSDSH